MSHFVWETVNENHGPAAARKTYVIVVLFAVIGIKKRNETDPGPGNGVLC